MGIDAAGLLAEDFEELSRLALAASLLREAGPALKARVMAFGELLSTRLGAAFLESRGIAAAWLDARTALQCREEPPAAGPRAYLSATCDFERDEELVARLAAPAGGGRHPGVHRPEPRGADGAARPRRLGHLRRLLRRPPRGRAVRDLDRRARPVHGQPGAPPLGPPAARPDYEEAQEIASTGAKVLHPRSIPPLRRHGIPLHVLSTDRPDTPGTVISAAGPAEGPQVKAISSRGGITLISMETVGMWQEVGFLARAFEVFARHGLSIDSVSTSETNVTVSLDPEANALEPLALRALLDDLAAFCEPRVIAPTASLSLVGRGIRAILHELGPVFEAFEELKVHLLTQSASDLNLTFLVDEEQSERLVRQLHGLLFGHKGERPVFGPTWSELFGGEGEGTGAAADGGGPAGASCWTLAAASGPVYAYDADTLRASASSLRALTSSTGSSIRSRRTPSRTCCGSSTTRGSASSASRPRSSTTCWRSSPSSTPRGSSSPPTSRRARSTGGASRRGRG